MRFCCILTLCILYSLTCKAQKSERVFLGRLVIDTSYKDDMNPGLGLPPLSKSKYPIELRLFWSDGAHPYPTLKAILFYYTTKWACRKIYTDVNGKIIKEDIALNDLDSVYYQLAINNVFSLPSESEAYFTNEYYIPKTNSFEGDTGLNQGHGEGFSIEFKVGDGFRKYHFGTPQNLVTSYPSFTEGKNYLAIANIIKQLYKLPINGK